jgi:shikimate kinase
VTQASAVVLIGLRGSGKSTVGRLLATRTGRAFVDLDTVTPGLMGETVLAAAWAKHGQAAFREAETRALQTPQVAGAGIIALGGGTPTAPGAEGVLAGRVGAGARLIYLRADAPALAKRLAASNNAHRPSLTGADPLVEIATVLATRDPLYLRLATDVIEVGSASAGEVCDQVVRIAGW